ncbi:legumain-like [Physella acuta]|uniref:legumain-like n=1 Tax=Physella acuta TaxID=109671 RepID=UPI0027DD719E|nr:legumain-like [Physella acuta]
MKLLLLLSLAALLAGTEGVRKNWALLIAGSSGYINYRHQADICHAYQIMHKAGIPDEQIVVMMYDDIAHNKENPVKGNIINKPKGPNVYPGVLKDYTGRDVNAKTFLAVLQGDKEAIRQLTGKDGKVINSGPEDYIFVNFADHGAPGILGMPQTPYLKARELNTVLKKMAAEKKFAKLNFYVEACESGSVFDKLLPANINVYATTAANTTESSWGCYWDDSRNAYLGDTYSVNWMEDTDKADLSKETFEQQYEKVKVETNQSHVQQYGDLSIDKLTLNAFFGNDKQYVKLNTNTEVPEMRDQVPEMRDQVPEMRDQVPSEMVAIRTLENRLAKAPANSLERSRVEVQLAELKRTMSLTHQLIWDIVRTVYSELPENVVYGTVMKTHEEIRDWDCYEMAVDTLLAFCPGLDISSNDFALRKFYALVNLCNNNGQGRVISAIESATVANQLCRV